MDQDVQFALAILGKKLPRQIFDQVTECFPRYLQTNFPPELLVMVLGFQFVNGGLTLRQDMHRFCQLRLVCKAFDRAVFLCIRTITMTSLANVFFDKLCRQTQDFSTQYNLLSNCSDLLERKQSDLQLDIELLQTQSNHVQSQNPAIKTYPLICAYLDGKTLNEKELGIVQTSEQFQFIKTLQDLIAKHEEKTHAIFQNQCQIFAKFIARFVNVTIAALPEIWSSNLYSLKKDFFFHVVNSLGSVQSILTIGEGTHSFLSFLHSNDHTFLKLRHLTIILCKDANSVDDRFIINNEKKSFEKIKKFSLELTSSQHIVFHNPDLNKLSKFLPNAETLEIVVPQRSSYKPADARSLQSFVWPLAAMKTWLKGSRVKKLIIRRYDKETPQDFHWETIHWKQNDRFVDYDPMLLQTKWDYPTRIGNPIVCQAENSVSSLTMFSPNLKQFLQDLDIDQFEHNLNSNPSDSSAKPSKRLR